jgi:hypothetical protein
VVALSAVPAAVIVLEPGLKPAELTRIARHWPERVLPGFPLQDPIAPRLRVRESLGHLLPFIPRHKSIGDSTPLACDVPRTDLIWRHVFRSRQTPLPCPYTNDERASRRQIGRDAAAVLADDPW